MKKKVRYDLVVCTDFLEFLNAELRFGPLLPLSVVHRLVRRHRSRVYQMASEKKLRIVSVMGLLMTPKKDVQKIWPNK